MSVIQRIQVSPQIKRGDDARRVTWKEEKYDNLLLKLKEIKCCRGDFTLSLVLVSSGKDRNRPLPGPRRWRQSEKSTISKVKKI